jgi:hypothetical protein
VFLVDQRALALRPALAPGRGEDQRRRALPVVTFRAVGLFIALHVLIPEQHLLPPML